MQLVELSLLTELFVFCLLRLSLCWTPFLSLRRSHIFQRTVGKGQVLSERSSRATLSVKLDSHLLGASGAP